MKLLIVEDDLMIADMVELILVESGYDVCGIARTVDEAVALARLHRPDLAMIDMRLADSGIGSDVAAQLGALDHLGILYATANAWSASLTAADGHGCLSKPYLPADLLRSLQIVADIVATGTASPPYPRGFRVLHPPPATSAPSRP